MSEAVDWLLVSHVGERRRVQLSLGGRVMAGLRAGIPAIFVRLGGPESSEYLCLAYDDIDEFEYQAGLVGVDDAARIVAASCRARRAAEAASA